MKILGICCSPRLGGNTEILLQQSLAQAQEVGAEVELLTLAGKSVTPCDGCLSCRQTKVCRIKDDMQDIYAKLLAADGIVFGTPVYFDTVCAQAKALMDRTYVFLPDRKLRDKVAGLVVTTGRLGGTTASTVFSIFFNVHRMIPAGVAIGFGGTDRGKIREDERGMTDAEALGRAVVRRVQSYRVPE